MGLWRISSKDSRWLRGLCRLVAVAFLLRALIPTGYMPDFEAARHGHLQFVICSSSGNAGGIVTPHADHSGHRASGPHAGHEEHASHAAHTSHADHAAHVAHVAHVAAATSGHHAAADHGIAAAPVTEPGHADHEHDGNIAHPPCLFAAVTAAITLPVLGGLISVEPPGGTRTAWAPIAFTLPPVHVGPQVGSRAPPVSIA